MLLFVFDLMLHAWLHVFCQKILNTLYYPALLAVCLVRTSLFLHLKTKCFPKSGHQKCLEHRTPLCWCELQFICSLSLQTSHLVLPENQEAAQIRFIVSISGTSLLTFIQAGSRPLCFWAFCLKYRLRFILILSACDRFALDSATLTSQLSAGLLMKAQKHSLGNFRPWRVCLCWDCLT